MTLLPSSCSSSFFFFFFIIIIFFCFFSSTTRADAHAAAAASACPPIIPPFGGPRTEHGQFKVVVPNITQGSLRQFVDCSNPSMVRGFCIDVFETALSILKYPNFSSANISYTCFNFSVDPKTNTTPTYTDMVNDVANGKYDAVVGDTTITAERAYKIDFTPPYIESGMVIITKETNDHMGSDWMFFGTPFTCRMWSMIVGAFACTGLLLYILEHKSNPEFIDGSFSKRISKGFLFTMEALVLLQRESIKSTTAQILMVVWTFGAFLVASSYIAGLSSNLTVSNLSSATVDIITIKESNETIGYRRGSVTEDFLKTRFHIQETQLKAIRRTVDFIGNITKGPLSGGVIAIVDELPYANIMLANLSCDYSITEPKLTSEGFGFGFRKNHTNLVKAFSIALLNLSESGCLQEMQLQNSIGAPNSCSLDHVQSKKISWKSILPMIIALLLVSYSCVIIHYIIEKKKKCNEDTLIQDANLDMELSFFP